ncbi:DUF4202 domain-containing protein [Chitinophagaceae bacterium LB-8]|uniref:DUF4202 domain-containing protein n=1 Tax=Paraflavisolibacter caeni TaxID=2982496 RepID=A0A9X2XVT4_9BACT|nr:DUF4202 domain-containing protein [Paraflavisolibacter caeni]MCU7550294.1 DUF4202 domain-containing protein [Paraflavisolibacter caeni]
MNKVEAAIELFDDYNRQDPRKIVVDGVTYPYEYFYALQLYHWVKKLEPAASDVLLLASRCQHIGRWQKPRETYPADKIGYHKWRTDLAKLHAEKAGEFMLQAGMDENSIKAVQHIILKKQLRTDYEVQVMENALCLVFLQFQYNEFLQKHDDETMIRILQKTWNKMTEPGRNAALSLKYNDRGKELISKALSS